MSERLITPPKIRNHGGFMDVGAVVFLIFLLIAAAIMLLAFMLEESAQKKGRGTEERRGNPG